MTVKELIKEVFEEIGAYGIGDSIEADDENKAFIRLNLLLEQFSGHRSLVNRRVTEEFSTVGGQGTYTIGDDVAADINTIKPMRIARMYYREGDKDRPIHQLSEDERAAVPYKTTEGEVRKFFYDTNSPIATIELYYIPNRILTIFMESEKQLTTFASKNDVIELPVGYTSALLYNLAVDLSDSFGKIVTPELKSKAKNARRQIAMINSRPAPARQGMYNLNLSNTTRKNRRGGIDGL
jgi:hypothetical protein